MAATSRTGPRRSEASRQAILRAGFALLQEDGFDRLSIEAIAARAGVGKTTIYRWWASKGVLAVEAFLTAVTQDIAFTQGACASADLRQQMRALATLYRGPTGRFVREMIGASQTDPDMHDAFVRGFLVPRRQAAREVIRRGIATGEFAADIDPDLAMDALYGPIYYRLLTSRAPFDDRFVDTLADLVLRALAG